MDIKPAIGITAGSFDLLHCGHLLMLEEIKKDCDTVIVCLQTDPSLDRPHKNRPIETMYERYKRLIHSEFVDIIIPYDTENDLETILRYTEYDYRYLSMEYFGKDFTGKDIFPDKIRYNSRTHSYSSSSLRERIQKSLS